jgi:hypothetical protein
MWFLFQDTDKEGRGFAFPQKLPLSPSSNHPYTPRKREISFGYRFAELSACFFRRIPHFFAQAGEKTAIVKFSPDIQNRKNGHIDDYLDRTIDNALQKLPNLRFKGFENSFRYKKNY